MSESRYKYDEYAACLNYFLFCTHQRITRRLVTEGLGEHIATPNSVGDRRYSPSDMLPILTNKCPHGPFVQSYFNAPNSHK